MFMKKFKAFANKKTYKQTASYEKNSLYIFTSKICEYIRNDYDKCHKCGDTNCYSIMLTILDSMWHVSCSKETYFQQSYNEGIRFAQ